MVQYANPQCPFPTTSFVRAADPNRPMTNWMMMNLARKDGAIVNSWGTVSLVPGETTERAVNWFYERAVANDPSLKDASLMGVTVLPAVLRRRTLRAVLADTWARLTYRPQPPVLPTEVWAVLTDEGLVAVAETMDQAEELLFATVSEDGGRTVEDLREEYTLDLKLGEWCLASKATGYRVREMRIMKVPATWSER